jgi:Holliday junction resolvase RusA-like endonuclease
LTDFGGKTSIFSHPVYLFLRKFSLQDSRGGSRLRIKVIADVPDSRRRDLDNILKGLLDSLIHAGFAEDDEQFDDIRVIRGVKVPGGRLGIKITELENA